MADASRLAAAMVLLASCGRGEVPIRAGELSIVPGYANAAPTGDGGVAYFVIRNDGAAPDTLESVAVAGAGIAHLHSVGRAGGLERMTPLERPTIPPHGALVLQPGQAHLMFERPNRPLHVGDTVTAQLRFARNGAAKVPLIVRPYGG